MRLASLGIAVLLGACAAPPSAYYSLSGPLPAEPSPSVRAADYGVRMEAVRIPAEVDRPQLVVRRDAADADVALLNESLWAAPLADQIRAALAARVSRALDVPDLSLMAAPKDLPLREVAVQVTRFDLVFNQYAGLEANWAEGRHAGSGAQLCRVVLRVPTAGQGVAALVEAQRTAVALLADVIAARMDPVAPTPDDPAILRDSCT